MFFKSLDKHNDTTQIDTHYMRNLTDFSGRIYSRTNIATTSGFKVAFKTYS